MTALLLLLAFAHADEGPEALVEKALATHPDLGSRRAAVAEMSARAEVSRAWPDPMLEVAVMDVPVDSWKFSREPMAGVELRVEQMFPDARSLRRAHEMAVAEQAMAEADEDAAALVLAREVETAFWSLALVRQQVVLYERHIAATEELTEAVRLRYEVGATGQSGLARLELLGARLEQDRAELLRIGAEFQADLARATGEPEVDTPEETAPVAPDADVAAWLARAEAANPMLAGIDALAAREQGRADMARAEAAPDVTLFASYRFRFEQDDPIMGGGSDLFSAGIMLPIPLGSGRAAGGEREAALQAVAGADARHESAVRELAAELTKLHAAWTRASEKAAAFDAEILPDARRVRDVTFTDYRVGKAEFEALYMAEIDLLELEREARAAAIETRILAAEARAAIGSPP